MSGFLFTKVGPGHFEVDGELTFAAMDKKVISSFSALLAQKEITLDLGKISNADSAGLALMLEWTKHARSKRVQLRFLNIPGQILNLAKLSNLDLTTCFISS